METRVGVFNLLLSLLLATALIGCAGEGVTKSTGEYIDDAAITARVKTKLFESDETSGTQVKVDTYKGVVQLSGFVNNSEARQRAGALARETTGVKRVVNNIVVKPAEQAGS